MLVLGRKTGERIHIGDSIEVVVLAVRGNSVKLGITAPREIPVQRAELLEKIGAIELVESDTGSRELAAVCD